MRCVSFWALHTLVFWSCLTMLACPDTKKWRTFLFGCCSVTKSCPALHNPMDCSMSGFPILHYFLEFAQTHVHWLSDAISSSVAPFSCLQSFPASGSFPVSWLFTLGGQSIGASDSASVCSVNIQGRFPLGLTGMVSLLSKGLSRVFSSTTVWMHLQHSTFFMVQLSHPYMTMEKP